MLTEQQVTELKATKAEGRNRIAKAMELASLTQVQLAERTQFTQSYISRVKSGQYADLPGETMRTFADCFGCSIEDLFPSSRQAVA